MDRPEGTLLRGVPREARGAESALHDIANSLASARSYAEVLRTRARIGALHTPEPLLDDVLVELDRVASLIREVRQGARLETERSMAWAQEEIFEPAEAAAALVEHAGREAEEGGAAELGGLLARAGRELARIRGLAQALPDRAPPGAHLSEVDMEEVWAGLMAGPLGDEARRRSAVVVRPSPLLPARANRILAERVLAALVSNALRHNPAPYPEVEVGGRLLPGGLHEYWVRDNGPGMAAEEAPGPGLAAARRAVEAMGGHLVLEPPPLGDGTLARFTLQAARGAGKG